MPPQTITVTLFVDTANVTLTNMNQTCNFGQQTGISNCDFTVEVNPGDLIVWQGLPMQTNPPSTDTVKILAIWCQTDRPGRIRSVNVMGPFSRNDDADRTVSSRVTGRPNQNETYKLFFQVNKNGVPNAIYFIDPKIIVKPGSV